MNKLFWSAFAMSLILLSPKLSAQIEDIDDFLGLEEEILPELKNDSLPQNPTWKVKAEKAELEEEGPIYGQQFSTIPWSTLDPSAWLSINTWIAERELKDQNPDWKVRLRAAHHKELVGKILQCKGSCKIFRGTEKASVTHLSRVQEGDEIITEKDSVAWIFMMDGSLLRLASETSVSLHEINVGKSEIFFLARLNQGHAYWHPRSKKELAVDDGPETDSMSLPLMVREANLEAFQREIFQKQNDAGRLNEILTLNLDAVLNQFKFLNQQISENTPQLPLSTRIMFVSPNSTIVGKDVSFDFVFLSGGKSYFKKRSTESGEEFSLHLRGYAKVEPNTISDEKWHEIDNTGRVFTTLDEVPGTLTILELITKRIKSIEVAREIWIKKFTLPLIKALPDPAVTARDFGYVVWGDDLEKRFNYLVEYTRRIETTNLRSLENLVTKLEGKGEAIKRELSADLYQKSLNHYLFGLKKRYDKKSMRVKEFSDLQYYVWILRNGKF